MLDVSYQRLLTGLTGVSAFLGVNHQTRTLLDQIIRQSEPSILEQQLDDLRRAAPSPTQWKVQEHCAAVGRIYALFEQYVEGQVAEWLEFSCATGLYSALPKKLQDSYSAGFTYVLGELHKVRYLHLVRDDMIAEFHKALSGTPGYKLTPECLNYHSANLRWDDLVDVLGRTGVENFPTWAAQNDELATYFGSSRRLKEMAETRLKNLVQYRNDAAHGTVAVDEIVGFEELIDSAVFIGRLATAIHQMFLSSMIDTMIIDGRASEVGVITEIYSDNIVVGNFEGVTLAPECPLVLCSERAAVRRVVQSVKVADRDVANVVVAGAAGNRA